MNIKINVLCKLDIIIVKFALMFCVVNESLILSSESSIRKCRGVLQCCGSGPLFEIRISIWIRGSGYKKLESGSGRPKKTGSNRIRILFINVFYVNQKLYFLWHFLTKSKHAMSMTLKINDKKLFRRNWNLDNFIQREN